MAPIKSHSNNPFAFARWPVTLTVTVVYLALFIPLIVIHHVVPSAPRTSPKGLNISEAWRDLQFLTDGYHPYNSRRNDDVHDWLLDRIKDILEARASEEEYFSADEEKPEVFVFDDMQSSLTFAGGWGSGPTTGVYFEGTNIIVYIRGSDDDKERWWEVPDGMPAGNGGVLVNSHYDSVSTGFGATDDGVGVITCLQLIKYFTTPGHAPKKGLVVLFNNGEEDYLNGARVYSQHPMSRFTHTFLNLEGAGAGGRATLFRSTDMEVTSFYGRSGHPFGSVLCANGFDTRLIRSQTDYIVFDGQLGLRGLDVAFYEPRARYHTDQDDVRHTSKDSLWHMLSAAVATTEGLVSDSSDRFEGEPRDDGKVSSGSGNRAVWFDLFGDAFVVFRLHTLFALSVTLLIVAPLTLLFTSLALVKADRMYLFRSSAKLEGSDERIRLDGIRGFFRFPFLFVIPTGVTIALAYLVTKVNPLIIHSSEYAVWSMMISAWIFLAWFVSRVADFSRPSAFHRVYTLTWMFVLVWILLVIGTVYENQMHLAGGYFIFFYFVGTFLATWISYLELFSLPRKSEYISEITQSWRRPSHISSRLEASSGGEEEEDEQAVEEPTESTSLLHNGQRTTFANYVHVTGDTDDYEEDGDPNVYGHEQPWSSSMPQWTWLLQFLLLAPFIITLIGPLALMVTSALHQTGQDGSPALFIYICITLFVILLFSPLLPFIHRFTYHIPVFLLFVFIGTLIYNLSAFPFSESNRVKIFFFQEVDLDTGVNRASLTGVPPFVNDVVRSIPSAAGQDVTCALFRDRLQCSWDGLAPQVVESASSNGDDWVSFNVSREGSKPQARFSVSGKNTRACKLVFDSPISDFNVLGSALDPQRFPHIAPEGGKEILLWSREWEHTWEVDVKWSESYGGLSGKAVCLWSDDNQEGVIPALDEVRRYSPAWVAVTKLTDGLVEGSRRFEV